MTLHSLVSLPFLCDYNTGEDHLRSSGKIRVPMSHHQIQVRSIQRIQTYIQQTYMVCCNIK